MIHSDSFITSPADLGREGKCKRIFIAEGCLFPKSAGLPPWGPFDVGAFHLRVDFDGRTLELGTGSYRSLDRSLYAWDNTALV